MRDRTFTISVRWLTIGLAVLLVALVLPAVAIAAGGSFTDDDTSIFEADIEWLADSGVTRGCNPPANDRFCPEEYVTRGQMAAFMRRFAQFLGAEDGVVDEAFIATNAQAALWSWNGDRVDGYRGHGLCDITCVPLFGKHVNHSALQKCHDLLCTLFDFVSPLGAELFQTPGHKFPERKGKLLIQGNMNQPDALPPERIGIGRARRNQPRSKTPADTVDLVGNTQDSPGNRFRQNPATARPSRRACRTTASPSPPVGRETGCTGTA